MGTAKSVTSTKSSQRVKSASSSSAVRFTSAKRHKQAKAAASSYGKAKKRAGNLLAAGAKATGKTVRTSVRQAANKAARQRATRRGRRIQAIATLYVLLVVISAATAAALATRYHYRATPSSNNPFSASQQAAAGFTLYYPAQLPAGYQIDRTSLSTVQQRIINLRISNATGGTIAVTQQPPPAGFNFNTLYNTFGNRQSFQVKLGTVTSGTIDGGRTHLVSLVTPDNTWILISTAQALPQADLQTIFGHLQAATAATAPAQ